MDLLRSLPLGLYLEQPITWIHRLDPRVKLGWLMAFLLTPLLANLPWRLGMVGALFALTWLAQIPWRVWRKQIGWTLLFSLLVLGVTTLLPDGLAVRHQPRLPMDDIQFAQKPPPLPTPKVPRPWYNPFEGWNNRPSPSLQSPTPDRQPGHKSYRYSLFHFGWVTITQQSLNLGIRLGTGYFTLIYGAALFLLTTAPEEITTALTFFLHPLRRWQVPIIEIILTLTLSLRFIPLVLEEVQNLVRSVRTRAINWQKLGFRGSVQLGLTVSDRLLENLFLRAEQISSAMAVRGFTSPNQHQVQWFQLRMRSRDWLALGILALLIGFRIALGIELS